MSFTPEMPVSGSLPPECIRPTPAQSNAALLCVTQPLDIMGSGEFLERARRISRSSPFLVVDLQKADFIDSTGVRALLSLAEELEAQGKELRLIVCPQSRVERTMGLLRLQERFRIYSSLEDAWARERAPVS